MGNCFALEFFCLGVFFRVWVSVKNLQLPIFLRQTWRRQTRIARFPVRSREGTEEGQRWLPDALAQLWGNPRGPLVRPLPLLSMLAMKAELMWEGSAQKCPESWNARAGSAPCSAHLLYRKGRGKGLLRSHAPPHCRVPTESRLHHCVLLGTERASHLLPSLRKQAVI